MTNIASETGLTLAVPDRGHRLQQGLLGHWYFDATYGGFSPDLGLAQGMAETQGSFANPTLVGGHLFFDPTGGHRVMVGLGPGECYKPTEAVTLYIRGITTALPGSQWRVWAKWGPNVDPAFGCFAIQQIGGDNTSVRWLVATTSGYNSINSASGALTIGSVCDLFGVYDGQTQVFYLDGIEIGRSNVLSGPLDPAYLNTIGLYFGSSQGNTHFFDGYLYESRLYNRALSADEVAELTYDRHADYRIPVSVFFVPEGGPPPTGLVGRVQATSNQSVSVGAQLTDTRLVGRIQESAHQSVQARGALRPEPVKVQAQSEQSVNVDYAFGIPAALLGRVAETAQQSVAVHALLESMELVGAVGLNTQQSVAVHSVLTDVEIRVTIPVTSNQSVAALAVLLDTRLVGTAPATSHQTISIGPVLMDMRLIEAVPVTAQQSVSVRAVGETMAAAAVTSTQSVSIGTILGIPSAGGSALAYFLRPRRR